jgi:hypothetical protein
MPEQRAPDRADLIAAVEQSPAAAGAHDRGGWVDLFAPHGRVEDPVGSRPHRGRARNQRLYDTFNGPRDIVFHRDLDVVSDHTVIRDLTLEVAMGASVLMSIPAYLRYDLGSLDDQLRIVGLQAFWELPAMVVQFARSGLGAVPAGLGLAGGLLRNQGPLGAAGFAAGFRGVGARGKRHVAEIVDSLCSGNEMAVRRLLGDRVPITLGDEVGISAADLVTRLRGGRWHKMIAAGHTVTVGVEANGQRGVLFTDLRPGRPAITRIRLFTEAG